MRSRLLDLRDFLACGVGRPACGRAVRRWSAPEGPLTAYDRFPSTRRTWWACPTLRGQTRWRHDRQRADAQRLR